MIHKDIQKLSVDIESLIPHPRNVRQGDVGAISQSLEHNGQYRPIVVQKTTNHILAGNHTWKAAQALGWKKIAVTFVDVDDERALRILLADNKTNDLATYDDNQLAGLLQELSETEQGLLGTVFDGDDLDQLLADLENTHTDTENIYTQKIAVPQYEIVGEEPEPQELVDLSRVNKLQQHIEQLELPNDVKQFLIMGTWRHARFNYRKIAEFYPHQNKDTQKLMEESALVIIDSDDAIAYGYAKFQKTIDEMIEEDRTDTSL
jgi:hypothetical protein